MERAGREPRRAGASRRQNFLAADQRCAGGWVCHRSNWPDLTEKLRKYLNEPQVTVIVTAINSQRVFVVGEVLRAGAFPLIPGMTVLQALSSAGGFTTFADVKKIHVMRLSDGKHFELPFNYRDVLKGDNPEQNIKLEPGDTVVVP